MITIPVVVLLSVVLVVGLVLGFVAGRYALVAKYRGEVLVVNAITSHFDHPHVLLNNVTLEAGEGTTQIDHVLVADTGIFVIEAKHYQGWIFGEPNQSRWTQVIYKKKCQFQNPIRQNFAHIKTLQSLFTLPENNFFSLVVFTGDAEFKSDLGPQVIKLGNLIERLTEGRPVIFDARKMAYIVGRIEMKRQRRSLETDEYHVNYVRTKIARS